MLMEHHFVIIITLYKTFKYKLTIYNNKCGSYMYACINSCIDMYFVDVSFLLYSVSLEFLDQSMNLYMQGTNTTGLE